MNNGRGRVTDPKLIRELDEQELEMDRSRALEVILQEAEASFSYKIANAYESPNARPELRDAIKTVREFLNEKNADIGIDKYRAPKINTYVFDDLRKELQDALTNYRDFPDGQFFEEENVYISGVGQFMSNIHPISACASRGSCQIHNPSDHHMRHLPVLIRETLKAERICLHGVGHPDPDWLDYQRATRTPEGASAEGVHGCDGCCATTKRPH